MERESRSPPIREGNNPEHQDVVIFERIQAYPDYIIKNCERDSR